VARAYFEYTAKDEAGNAWANAAVYLFAAGTATDDDPPLGTGITGSVFDVRTGGTALVMPLIADVDGKVAVWLTTAQEVDVVVTDNDGTAFRPALSSAPYNFPPQINHAVANVPPDEVASDAELIEALSDHLTTADEHTAELVAFAPETGFTASDVQAAIVEAAAIGTGQGPGVTAHSLLSGLTADDHTQYQKESEKDANNGYAGLNASGKIPAANVAITPAGTIASTTLPAALQEVADDAATALQSHEADWASFAMLSATFSRSGGIEATPGTHRWPVYGNWTVVAALGTVAVAPTGRSILVDVNYNGVSILGSTQNRIEILAGELSGSAANISSPALVSGGYLTCDVDQIGDTYAGEDLVVVIWARKT
jgi:hypothetical protein